MFGEFTGDYQYRSDFPAEARHARPVKWTKEIPRNQIDQDLLYSLGSARTVCRIQRHNAEDRIIELLKGKKKAQVNTSQELEETEETSFDIEQYARDQIVNAIIKKFKGHGLARLTAAILDAQGYQTRVSPEGADGGVDIIAGRGSLGFETPRLAVQVKSGDSPIDVGVMRELTGVMAAFGADSGLIVAWGGYRGSVEKESARQYFKIRLWDADTLVKMIQENYDNLSEDIQAELPLKRIWTLVSEEEE
jgi:restriction system protein